MSESKYYHFPLSGSLYGINTLDEAVTAAMEGGFVWFNFYQPTREMLSKLVEKIGIHPLSVEDCFDCLLYTSPSPRDRTRSRMPSSA